MMTVHEVSRIAGVSVRTLHHYDAIGLLRPTSVTDAGYRLYDQTALERLQTILLFRELQFPLKEIREILDRPGFDRQQALRDQLRLLELQRKRLDRLITLARDTIQHPQGGTPMSFDAFDKKELDRYAAEARQRWGGTEAWKESERNTARRTAAQQQETADGLMQVFAKFAALPDKDPASDAAQALAAELQQYITDHYYTCTKEILQGLGQMYTADERFAANIDRCGAGTADFASQAIAIYCGR